MRTRDYKSFAPEEYYHLFNRGNGKMEIFRDPADYNFFLSRIEEYLYPERKNRRAPSARYVRKSFPSNAFTLVAYCLMPNHYHLLFCQNNTFSLSALMLGLTTSYSKYFNKKYDRVGSLFQDQFKAVHVGSNEQLLWVSAYIHQNPRMSGLAQEPYVYPYSSYSEYVSSSGRNLCDTSIVLGQYKNKIEYQNFVKSSFDSIAGRKSAEGALLHESIWKK